MSQHPRPLRKSAPEAERVPVDPQVRRVLDAAGVAMASLDTEGHVVSTSSSFAALWGRRSEELVGLHLVGLCPEGDQAEVMASLVRLLEGVAEVERCELRLDAGAGSVRTVVVTFGRVTSGDGEAVLAVASDITLERRAERRRRRDVVELTRVATEDGATGLPNQLGFDALLASALRRSGRTGYPLSLLRCDLFGLSDVLSEHGPAVEAALLDTYAARLTHRLRPSDSVSRTDGDTFMVIAEDLGDEQDAAGVAYRLLSSALEPVVVDDLEVSLTMTIGIVVADGTASPELLVTSADLAFEQAMGDGVGGFRIIDVRPGLAA